MSCCSCQLWKWVDQPKCSSPAPSRCTSTLRIFRYSRKTCWMVWSGSWFNGMHAVWLTVVTSMSVTAWTRLPELVFVMSPLPTSNNVSWAKNDWRKTKEISSLNNNIFFPYEIHLLVDPAILLSRGFVWSRASRLRVIKKQPNIKANQPVSG